MTTHIATRLTLVLLFAWLLGSHAVSAQVPWSSTGPEGGQSTALVVDPSRPSVLYAGTSEQSLFKSTDGGVSWERSDTGLVDAYSIRALAVAPSDSEVVLAATSNGIQRSTDAGFTWSAVTGGPSGVAYDVGFESDRTVYAGSDGIYRSTDFGASWIRVENSQQILSIAVDRSGSGAVYAVDDEVGVLKSTDGMSWTSANHGLEGSAYAVAIDPENPSILFVTTRTAGVFRSTDGGANWAPLAGNTDSAWVVVSPADPDVLLGGSFGSIPSRLKKSIDGGETWSLVSGFPEDAFLGSVALDPSNPEVMYLGTSRGVWRSRDGGVGWIRGTQGFVATRARAVVVHPNDPSIVYAGTDHSGFWKSTDTGRSWSERNQGHEAHQSVFDLVIDPSAPDTLYAATFRGILKSTDGAATWNRLANDLSSTYVIGLGIDPQEPRILYAATDSRGMWKSVDAGMTFEPISVGLGQQFMESVIVDPSQPSRIYAGTNSGGLFRSDNAGEEWRRLESLPITFVNALAVHPADSAVLYAGSTVGSGGLYRSRDSGATWELVAGGLPRTLMRAVVIEPRDPQKVYVGTSSRGVFRSDDGGARWTHVADTDRLLFTIARAPGIVPTLFAGTAGRGVF